MTQCGQQAANTDHIVWGGIEISSSNYTSGSSHIDGSHSMSSEGKRKQRRQRRSTMKELQAQLFGVMMRDHSDDSRSSGSCIRARRQAPARSLPLPTTPRSREEHASPTRSWMRQLLGELHSPSRQHPQEIGTEPQTARQPRIEVQGELHSSSRQHPQKIGTEPPTARQLRFEAVALAISGPAAGATSHPAPPGAQHRSTGPGDEDAETSDVEAPHGDLDSEMGEFERAAVASLLEEFKKELLAEFWSRGSCRHTEGRCRPCHYIRDGCMNGLDCEFCHMPHRKNRKSSKPKRNKATKRAAQADAPCDDEPPLPDADAALGTTAAPRLQTASDAAGSGCATAVPLGGPSLLRIAGLVSL